MNRDVANLAFIVLWSLTVDANDATPVGELPIALCRIPLRRLPRSDLDALCSLKLWCEAGVPFERSLALLSECSIEWVRGYLESLPRAIGGAPIDNHILERARARVAHRRARARVCFEPNEDTRTNLTLVA